VTGARHYFGGLLAFFLTANSLSALGDNAKVNALQADVADLREQLAAAEKALVQAQLDEQTAQQQSTDLQTELDNQRHADAGFALGPVTIGGAMRVNYVYGSYEGSDSGPNRGGDGGNVELDTFRINLALDYGNIIGKLEYRWYPADTGRSYSFLHTGWLGYRFDESSHIEAGLTRVPFGAGPYGISQSWFFDQHYYVGLADDPDMGLKYSTHLDNWSLDLAYYASSEPSFSGRSEDSTRYGYDAVRWTESIDENGNVIFGGARNGYQEEDQFNVRGIYHLVSDMGKTDIGLSLQYGQLDGTAVDDGDHWASAGHIVHQVGDFTLGAQLSRYEFDIDADNPWGTDQLIPMGAYDFAWPVAAKAWLPALSASYKVSTAEIPWLDYVLPYLEWSSIIKDENAFNDSQLYVLGAAWARGGWYIYSDLAYSDGNYFVGDKRDNYSRLGILGLPGMISGTIGLI
jgi:hypothetical protein